MMGGDEAASQQLVDEMGGEDMVEQMMAQMMQRMP